MHIFAALGSNPELSLAEIAAVTRLKPSKHSKEIALFDDAAFDLLQIQARLGGVSKFGYIVGSLHRATKEEIADFLVSQLLLEPKAKKLAFGISIYEMEPTGRTSELRGMQKAIAMEMKNRLRLAGHGSRYVTTRHETLSSADVTMNNLLEKGAEFVLLAFEKELLIGETATVQDFAAWSHRDYDRPARDARRGMLPPKLARMMINLSTIPAQDAVLLDPFCGSGTVLMEAALLGCEKMIGSDIAPSAVEDTKTNLAWLHKEGFAFPDPELIVSTAANLHARVKPLTVDLIVTEPFLGNPRRGSENKKEIEAIVMELIGLYKDSFASLYKLLKPGGTIVVASPVHYLGREALPVPTRDILINLGLTELPLSDSSVIYRREGQFVGREILRFTKG